jgi:hypothetical protein
MKWNLLLCASLVFYGACSSKKKKIQEVDNSATIKLDYEVREATTPIRPGWMVDANDWVEQEQVKDAEKFRYFSFETEPKVNREIACNLAKANARVDIASEVTTFIQKHLGSSQEGQSAIDANNPKTQPLRDFVENTLAEKVQAMLNGASVVKTYWEKRQYLQKLGAKKDYIGFTCAALVRMDKKLLKSAIDKASENIVAKADDPETKANVKKALENIDDAFEKTRKGEL